MNDEQKIFDRLHVYLTISTYVDSNEKLILSLYPQCNINGDIIPQAFDLYEFFRLSETGEGELFTCSCGIAGCAGIHTKLMVIFKDDNSVEWVVPEDAVDDYNFLNKQKYVFSKSEYIQTVSDAFYVLENLAKSGIEIYDQFTHFYDEKYLLKNTIKHYEDFFDIIE